MNDQRRLPWARYAIEFTILFLGVFLAFLSDAYRDSLQDREREREYLEAISCEISDEIAEFDKTAKHYAYKLKRMDRFFELVEDQTSSRDSLELALRSFVFMFPFPATPQTAYQSMKSSGELRLIRDKNMRFGLVRLETSRDDASGQGAILQGFLSGPHAAYLLSIYDYNKARTTNPAVIRSSETRSRLKLCRGEVSSYCYFLNEHLTRLRESQQMLKPAFPCGTSADSTRR